jgi:uncharacterized protein (DUF1499 family)
MLISILKWVFIVAAVIVVAGLAALSYTTRETRISTEPRPQLRACPGTPNCVSSLSDDPQFSIKPILLDDTDSNTAWQRLTAAIEQSGGEIVRQDDRYLHAVYTSTLFRFKDDLEAVLSENRIDIRSASRAGKSDLGKNRQRVERLLAVYSELEVK